MLKRFEVKNFRNFKERFVFDLSNTKNYEFNPECIENGFVKKALIYGPNGCGKSNLGVAIFDIKNHLTDDKIDEQYSSNYLNAETGYDLAEFSFSFQFAENELVYSYGKKSVSHIVYEKLCINGKTVIELDWRKSNTAFIDLKGAENLRREMGNTISNPNAISVVKYVNNNSILEINDLNMTFVTFIGFISTMEFIPTPFLTGRFPTDIILDEEDGIKKLENFLNEFNIDCRLTTLERDGKKNIAFDFGHTKIDFFPNASTGTVSLANQFIMLHYIEIIVDICHEYKKWHTLHDEGNVLLKEIDNNGLMPNFSTGVPKPYSPFIYLDEFDAFYHYAVSTSMVSMLKKLNCQVVLTTHNTSIMSNDLLRPDCYFIMSNKDIKPICDFTAKELRLAHNIEKMYRAGAFDEQ